MKNQQRRSPLEIPTTPLDSMPFKINKPAEKRRIKSELRKRKIDAFSQRTRMADYPSTPEETTDEVDKNGSTEKVKDEKATSSSMSMAMVSRKSREKRALLKKLLKKHKKLTKKEKAMRMSPVITFAGLGASLFKDIADPLKMLVSFIPYLGQVLWFTFEVFNLFVGAFLAILFYSKGATFRKWFKKKQLKKFATISMLELIPGVNAIPFHTATFLSILRESGIKADNIKEQIKKLDKEIKKVYRKKF